MEKRYNFQFRYQTLRWEFEGDEEKKIHQIKRPAVAILLKGKHKVELIEPFLLDSGADNPFIKYDLAQLLELKLSEDTSKVKTAGRDIDVYTSRVNMGLIQKNGYYELGKNVFCFVFPEGKDDVPNVMGRIPLFNTFRIVFEQYNDIVRLTYMGKVMSRKTGQRRKR